VGLFVISFFGFPSLRSYCILIGAAAAIGGFIPYLGSIIGVTPGILIVLFTGEVSWGTKILGMASVLGVFALINAVEGFVLQPKIVGKGAGLHPLIVMLALIAGAQFGIGAMIIAVPVACIIRVLVRELYWLPIEQREAALVENAGQMTE
jgi:predicted PurR-regulated permease PerM